MKKYLKFIVVAASVMAVACSKENGQDIADEQRGTINVCIDGEINGYSADEDTKAEAQTVVRIMWAGDETVYAYDATEYLGYLTASIEGTNGLYAKLTGTIKNTSASKITLVYSPQFSSNPEEHPVLSDGKISLDLSNQNQAAVPFLVYGVLDASKASAAINNAKVDFTLATSVLKCNCADLPSEGSFVKATIGEINTVCELTVRDDDAPVVAGSTLGKITRGNTGVTVGGQKAIFQVAIAPSTAVSRSIKVVKGSQIVIAEIPSKAFEGAKAYNSVFMFKTLNVPSVFTVDPEGKKVYFSKGNLQATYNGSGYTWDFAANQYDYIGDAAGNTTITDTGTNNNGAVVDLFGWSGTAFNYYGIYPSTGTFYYSGDFKDWGIAYCNSNSITPTTTWRTLTKDEWDYLFNTRTNASEKVGYAKVNNVNGIIILPDTFTDPMKNGGSNAFVPKSTTGWTANVYTTGGNWEAMEDAGAVFLPAAGSRYGSQVSNVGSRGCYWSSTAYDDDCAFGVYFQISGVYPDDYDNRCTGYSVRLVTESK